MISYFTLLYYIRFTYYYNINMLITWYECACANELMIDDIVRWTGHNYDWLVESVAINEKIVWYKVRPSPGRVWTYKTLSELTEAVREYYYSIEEISWACNEYTIESNTDDTWRITYAWDWEASVSSPSSRILESQWLLSRAPWSLRIDWDWERNVPILVDEREQVSPFRSSHQSGIYGILERNSNSNLGITNTLWSVTIDEPVHARNNSVINTLRTELSDSNQAETQHFRDLYRF